MTHLTVDEIIDFVSFNKIDNNTLKLAAKVNSHIVQCDSCLEKVKAFQMIYDEFKKAGNMNGFYQFIKESEKLKDCSRNSAEKESLKDLEM